MIINISNLSEGVHEYQFEENPSAVKLDEHFSKPVVVKAEIEKRRRQLFLTAHVKTAGRFVCDRCLDDFEKEIEIDYRMVYVYEMGDAGEIDKGEITVIHTSTNEIDIAEDVRQYTLLGVPLKLLCKDDCAGLCGNCGANLNHTACDCPKENGDPRWEELRKILNKN